MNTPTPYEQLIAAKLNQVPVPDMAESVWSSIGMQLDAGGPDQEDDTRDQGSNAPGKGSGLPGKGWFGFLGAVVMVATAWWYFNHVTTNTTQQTIPPRVIKEPAPVMDSPATIKKRDIRTAPVVIQKDTVQLQAPPKTIVSPDTMARQILLPVKVDSSSLHNDWVPLPFFDSLSVRPPARKPRGVKGITSDDYKISTGKERN